MGVDKGRLLLNSLKYSIYNYSVISNVMRLGGILSPNWEGARGKA
jgi:hypothetical protein